MPPQSLFLSLFFTLIYFPLCFSSLQGHPRADFLEKTPGYDPSTSHPSYFGINEAQMEESQRYDLQGTPATAPDLEVNVDDDLQGTPATAPDLEVNVDDFGAVGDGKTDDTEAFKKAWKETCSSNALVLLVPKNKKYRLKPITFPGPCKSDSIRLKIFGTMEASENPSDYASDKSHWLVFENIQNFEVQGDQGIIDGNGNIWWTNSCKIDKTKTCTEAPAAVSFIQCDNLQIFGLQVQNAQKMHVLIERSVNVKASNIIVNSPETSPDTAGIHVTSSENVYILSPVIKTGDDCISIVNGSKNVKALDVACGPGHGISVGILRGISDAQISNVLVDGAKLVGTTDGVKINTYPGGSGYVSNIVFQNIKMEKVSNIPLIIDQNYCDQGTSCPTQNSGIQIRNIAYKSISGSSATKETTKFDCSKTLPCQSIALVDINLAS